jgi:hypothetical protein
MYTGDNDMSANMSEEEQTLKTGAQMKNMTLTSLMSQVENSVLTIQNHMLLSM